MAFFDPNPSGNQTAGFPFDENVAAEIRNLRAPANGPAGSGTRGTRMAVAIPRYKYTYLVEFILSEEVRQFALTNARQFVDSGRIYGQLKSIDYPKHSYKIEKLRSYNKYVNVPVQIEYQPATLQFHDDATAMVMALYMDYMNYYHETGNIGATSVEPSSAPSRWGIDSKLVGDDVRLEMETRASMGMRVRSDRGRTFFESIIIHDLGTEPNAVNRHVYIRPVITMVDHDQYDHEDKSSKMSMTWTIEYEGYAFRVGENNLVSSILSQNTYQRPLVSSPATGYATMTRNGAASGNPISVLTIGTDGLFENNALDLLSGDALTQTSQAVPNARTVFSQDDIDKSIARDIGKLPVGSTVPRGSLLERALNASVTGELGVPPAGSARSVNNNYRYQNTSGLTNLPVSLNLGQFGLNTSGAGGFTLNNGAFNISNSPTYYNSYPYGYGSSYGTDSAYFANRQIDSRRYDMSQQQTRIEQLQRDRAWAQTLGRDTSYYDSEIAAAQRSVSRNNLSVVNLVSGLVNNRDTTSALINTLSLLG